MKAVIPCVHESFLAERKRLGQDQYDEMWEGVLHMAPAPSNEHQRFERDLAQYPHIRWAIPRNAEVLQQTNLALPGAGATWVDNYRIPDFIIVTADRAHIDCDTHFEGAPNVVVEIHSEGDEAYEKLPFYEQLEVPEVWIIDRDTKAVEIYLLRGGKLAPTPAGADGWMRSPSTGVEMRPAPGRKLSIRLDGDETTRRELPGKP